MAFSDDREMIRWRSRTAGGERDGQICDGTALAKEDRRVLVSG